MAMGYGDGVSLCFCFCCAVLIYVCMGGEFVIDGVN